MQVSAEYEVDNDNQRVASRFSTQMPAGVRRTGSIRIPATVTDVSVTGFRIQSDEKLVKGSTIWVKLGNLAPIAAHVVWVERLLAGCAFESPLHPSVLDQLLRTA